MNNDYKKPKAKNGSEITSSKLMSIGTNFVAGVGVFTYIGYYIDEKLGKKGFYLPIGAGIGLLWGFYETFKLVYLSNKKEKETEKNKK